MDHDDNRVFVTSRVILGIVRSCEDQWLNRIYTSVVNGHYHPSPPNLCDVPKGGGGIRPGTILTLEDQVVYTALVGTCFPSIKGALTRVDPPHDFAYQLLDSESPRWLKNRFGCWNAFRTESLRVLDEGVAMMVTTDITGFYDHISHEIMLSDLRAAEAPDASISLLGQCLGRWAMINGRGIPQGLSASDILAKLYLNRADQALREIGFRHYRYVDDFRIFCKDRAEAKRSLLHLQQVLRRRGLSLQSGKTRTLRSDAARRHIDGIMPTLLPLVEKYKHEIAALVGLSAAYMTVTELEEVLARKGVHPPTELLREIYQTYFVDAPDRFDKSLFHYLLARLGAASDPFAVDHALSMLEERPEETEYILEYLSAIGAPSGVEQFLDTYLRSAEAVYPYQHYQVLTWRLALNNPPGEELVILARQIARSEKTPGYLRSASIGFLAKFGSPSDLDYIAEAYATGRSEAEQAELLASLYRIEKTQRNALLGRARDDGFLPAQAVRLVKEERASQLFGVGLIGS